MTHRISLAIIASGWLAACSDNQAPGPDDAGKPVSEPQRVIATVGERTLTFAEGPELVGECSSGHRGFTATAAEERLQLNAFIFEAGTYHCSDPLPFIFVAWHNRSPTANYGISPTGNPAGVCEMVVDSIRPRFKARFSGTLPRVEGTEGPDTLPITAEINVVQPDSGGCGP